jgi:hypothetical protein
MPTIVQRQSQAVAWPKTTPHRSPQDEVLDNVEDLVRRPQAVHDLSFTCDGTGTLAALDKAHFGSRTNKPPLVLQKNMNQPATEKTRIRRHQRNPGSARIYWAN